MPEAEACCAVRSGAGVSLPCAGTRPGLPADRTAKETWGGHSPRSPSRWPPPRHAPPRHPAGTLPSDTRPTPCWPPTVRHPPDTRHRRVRQTTRGGRKCGVSDDFPVIAPRTVRLFSLQVWFLCRIECRYCQLSCEFDECKTMASRPLAMLWRPQRGLLTDIVSAS